MKTLLFIGSLLKALNLSSWPWVGRLQTNSQRDLHIEDTGQYNCQQYVNEQLLSSQTSVVLSLLTITADPIGDLKRGTALSLQCALVCNGGIADCSPPVNAELTWVDDEGTALQGDRFKITKYRTHSTLSLELQKSDHNRRWRCNLTEGGEVKALYSYTTTLTVSISKVELIIRVFIFCAVLIIPPSIGAVVYINRRSKRAAQEVTSGIQLTPVK
ncbi:uncharacterized protein LOC121298732 [Polyodon spathula]|uniref:uncharacterized protein LOC121298732 n=1 Tax=Polyodon spathula TaxID=7913 RepID=UPI001B7EF692|nr:uncharacterized protein LOC121298732 [Polyodon spathula]